MESIVKEVCKSVENELKDKKVDFTIYKCPTGAIQKSDKI